VLSGFLQTACVIELPLYSPNAKEGEARNCMLVTGEATWCACFCGCGAAIACKRDLCIGACLFAVLVTCITDPYTFVSGMLRARAPAIMPAHAAMMAGLIALHIRHVSYD
jgi:hypothetical protein